MLPCLAFYYVSGDLNLGPQACVASSFPTKPSPSHAEDLSPHLCQSNVLLILYVTLVQWHHGSRKACPLQTLSVGWNAGQVCSLATLVGLTSSWLVFSSVEQGERSGCMGLVGPLCNPLFAGDCLGVASWWELSEFESDVMVIGASFACAQSGRFFPHWLLHVCLHHVCFS